MGCINCKNDMAKTKTKTTERNFEVIKVGTSFDEPLVEATNTVANDDTNANEKERLFAILDGLIADGAQIEYKKSYSAARLQEIINAQNPA